jgi:hypothetical protein
VLDRQPVLTPQEHQQFLEHGFLVVKRAVPPERIATAIRTLEEGGCNGDPGPASGRPAPPPAAEACLNETTRRVLAELFGPGHAPRCGRGGMVSMPRPYQPGAEQHPWALHVDSDYPTPLPNGWALGMFVFLTRVRPGGGAFVLCPGSYRRLRALMAQDPAAAKAASALPEYTGPAHEILAEPGDLLFYHHLTAHCGSRNVRDPTTRHALLSWWTTEARLAPEPGPAEDLASLEKACSATYLHERFAMPLALPEFRQDERTTAALQHGLLTSSPTAQAVLHWGGEAHRFFMPETGLAVLRGCRTRDAVEWREGAALRLAVGRVRSLSLFAWGREVCLAVCLNRRTLLLTSTDLRTWNAAAELPPCACAAPFVLTPNASRHAAGRALFFVAPEDPTVVRFRWGPTWDNLSSGPIAAAAATGTRILDLEGRPVLAEEWFALIADRETRQGSRPIYWLSRDAARYEEPPRPIAFKAPTPPRRICVFARGEAYWLVIYARRQGDREQFFWGCIDWDQQPVSLREIRSAGELQAALVATGIR